MTIEKLNQHYSFTNPASIYDEEALTALELAGRQGAKINELVEEFNQLEKETDERLTTMNDKTMPQKVEDEIQERIDNGTFDAAINEYAGDLEARVDNLLGSMTEGSTTMDGEVIDLRLDLLGESSASAGASVRGQVADTLLALNGGLRVKQGELHPTTGAFTSMTTRLLTNLLVASEITLLKAKTGYRFRVFGYDKEFNFIMNVNGWDTVLVPEMFHTKDGFEHIHYIRVMLATEDSAEITLSEISNLEIYTRSELEKDGVKRIDDCFTAFGTFSSTTGIYDYRNNRLCTFFLENDFHHVFAGDGYILNASCYDEKLDWIGLVDGGSIPAYTPSDLVEGTKYVRFIIREKANAVLAEKEDHGFTVYTKNTELAERMKEDMNPFAAENMDIAYSSLGLAPINTLLHFKTAAHAGFNALKGDVRITSDGGLVMCHDAGVTLNDEGYITTLDDTSANYKAFLSMTLEEALSLEHETLIHGHRQRLCSFDEYLQICAEEHKIAFITLRNNNIGDLVENVYAALVKHGMVDRCIINSYEHDVLSRIRKHNGRIPVSLVLPFGQALTTALVEKAASLGNSILSLFYFAGASSETGRQLWTDTEEIIQTAKEKGVLIYAAIVYSSDDHLFLVHKGVKGQHIGSPVLHATPKEQHFIVKMDGGTPTFVCDNVMPTMSADVSKDSEGVVSITNIRLDEGLGEYDNGLPMTWFDRLPYVLQVNGGSNENAKVRYQNGRIQVETQNVDEWYRISVRI